MKRMIQRLNRDWWFKAGFEIADVGQPDTESYEAVTLPHTVHEVPFNYFCETSYQGWFCYQRQLDATQRARLENGQRLLLKFEGVMAFCEVYLDGKKLCQHKGGYTPFTIDLSDHLHEQSAGWITVAVDSQERVDIPPFGGQIDYLTYGGIYRDVWLEWVPELSVQHLKIEAINPLSDSKAVKISCLLANLKQQPTEVRWTIELLDQKGKIRAQKTGTDTLTEQLHTQLDHLEGLALWSPDAPIRYQIRVTLQGAFGEDMVSDWFGFRSAEFRPDGFFLNGERFKIRGVNRHQSWPYLGYAVGPRAQRKDAELLKHDYGMNLVRTSHYPQSKAFIERCDEIGLLVFEEIPGWQHLGDAAWQQQVLSDVEAMIQRDWNHPCIILWGVRINESADHHSLYQRTNELARKLDPTRQTGGVRCIENSELLEDVYTMNDFIHSGEDMVLRDQQAVTGLGQKVPYLVTEYNGHMFPTKRFDQEERQHEHVMRHLRILDRMYASDDISGAIGWCFFDYNTHKDFGSGDRICYHGITDMFRLPKHAAFAYSSQLSPEIRPVLHPVTIWARGERSISGAMPLLVLTNCDYIQFRYGQQAVRTIYPDRESFPHLPYAPVILDGRNLDPAELGEWGLVWDQLSLAGFVNGEQVIEKHFAPDPLPTRLKIVADDLQLSREEKELTRIAISALDQAGNPLPYWNPVVDLSLTGPGRIVGPVRLALSGGIAGTYVESNLNPGVIQLTVTIDGFASEQLDIVVA